MSCLKKVDACNCEKEVEGSQTVHFVCGLCGIASADVSYLKINKSTLPETTPTTRSLVRLPSSKLTHYPSIPPPYPQSRTLLSALPQPPTGVETPVSTRDHTD